MDGSSLETPYAPRRRANPDPHDKSGHPMPTEACRIVAEKFITLTPSMDISHCYGWNVDVLSALRDEITQEYNVDLDRIHVTGFSMGGQSFISFCL